MTIKKVRITPPSQLAREKSDACVFALDSEFMSECAEKPGSQKDVDSARGGLVAVANGGVELLIEAVQRGYL